MFFDGFSAFKHGCKSASSFARVTQAGQYRGTISTLNCGTDLIPHQTAQGALALCGNPSGDTGGSHSARLGDHNVARGVFLAIVVQDELRQLGGLATACGSADYHHRVVFYERNELGQEEVQACGQNVRTIALTLQFRW